MTAFPRTFLIIGTGAGYVHHVHSNAKAEEYPPLGKNNMLRYMLYPPHIRSRNKHQGLSTRTLPLLRLWLIIISSYMLICI